MKIIDKFLDKIMEIRERREAKRKQKMLIKADDDTIVVESLPSDEDNSEIDIKEVVESMEDPESKTKVVENNLEEIIKQNNVRNTMQHLPDEAVVKILEESQDELKEKRKIAFAIQAIQDDEQKLEVTEENLSNLTGLETADILNSIEEKRAEKVENKKIKLASEQILRILVKYGHVSQIDIDQMVLSLKSESSKLAIAKLCLAKIAEYDETKKKNITSKAKTEMVYYLLKITNVKMSEKNLFLNNCMKDNLLNPEEGKMIEEDFEKEKARQEQIEREKRFGKGARD